MTISMTNYFDDKFYLVDHLRMQPSEIEKLPYYEFLEIRKRLAEKLKKQEEHNRRMKDEQEKNKSSNSYKAPSMKFPKFNKPRLR